jgi:uncharacterized membrane protein
MKALFLATYLVAIIVSFVGYTMLPDHVATHFGLGGQPDDWMSKEVSLVFFLVVKTMLFLLIWYTPAMVTRLPSRWVNLPNKDYWLTESTMPQVKEKLDRLMPEFGAAIMAFFIMVKLLVLDANLSEPVQLNERVFLAGLGLFLAYVVFWTIRIYRGFRIPAATKGFD